jgi:DNA-binding Xre family transcriptional regulator
MATRQMFSTTDLRPLLAERGIVLSPSQVYRLVVEKPERLNLKVLMALLDILGCAMDELVEPVTATRSRAKKTADGTGAKDTAGVGSFRPRRARINRH